MATSDIRTISPAEYLHLSSQGQLPTVRYERFSFVLEERSKSEKKYGIQRNFWDKQVVDKPRISLRGDQSLDEFYRQVLTQKCALAVVVPYEQLGSLKARFPQLRIKQYEVWEDFWGYCNFQVRGRKKYEELIDMCQDSELWRLSRSITILEDDTLALVDCIVDTKEKSPEETVAKILSSRMWKDSEGKPGLWRTPGKRHDTPLGSVQIMITQLDERSCHLPIFKKTDPEEFSLMKMFAVRARAVVEYLQKECDGCGWISRNASCDVLILAIASDGPPRNVLAYPGTEHLHVLPVEEDRVIDWIDDGSVASRQVLLIDTKGNKYAILKDELGFTPELGGGLSVWEYEEKVYETGAGVVVYYCDHCSNCSPGTAERYLTWMLKKHQTSRQQVMVLHRGMCGFLQRAKELARCKDFFKITYTPF